MPHALAAIVLSAAVSTTGSSEVWKYHNDAFGYSAEFPKIANTTPCVFDGQDSYHGTDIIFHKNGDCDHVGRPMISVGAFFNALYWRTSMIAAEELCTRDAIWPTNLKIDGYPAVACSGPDADDRTCWAITYLAVTSRDGLILEVDLAAPRKDLEKYEPMLLSVMNSFKLDASTRR